MARVRGGVVGEPEILVQRRLVVRAVVDGARQRWGRDRDVAMQQKKADTEITKKFIESIG